MRIFRYSFETLPHLGGIEMHVAGLSREQAGQGHEMHLFTAIGGSAMPGVQVHKIEVPPAHSLLTKRRSKALFYWRAGKMARRLGSPSVHDLHGNLGDVVYAQFLPRDAPLIFNNHMGFNAHGLKKVIFRHFTKRVAWTISAASEVVPVLVACGLNASQISILPAGVDEDFFRMSPPPRHEGPFRVLVVGRLAPMKGHKFLLEAVRLIQLTGEAVSLAVVGEGPLEEELRIAAQGLPVKFLGRLNDTEKRIEMANCDAIVVPSVAAGKTKERETSPIVIGEAMALGKAVIASRVGGIEASIADHKSGLLVPPGDPQSLAEAILTLAKNPDLRIKLGRTAHLSVMDRRWEVVGARHSEILRRASPC